MVEVMQGIASWFFGLFEKITSSIANLRSAAVADAQLDEISKRQRPDLRSRIEKVFGSRGYSYRWVIENVGGGSAYDVDMGSCDKTLPLVVGDKEYKLPRRVLEAGDRIELIAALSIDTPLVYDVELVWSDMPRGSAQRKLVTVSING